jgi:hypothetical protein
MATAFDVWNKANPMVVTEEEIVQGSIAGAKMAAEVNRINDARRADNGWRQELDELTARLTGMPSTEEAEARLDNLRKAVAAQVKEHEAKIAECREALKARFLSPPEQTHVAQKIEQTQGQLAELQRDTRVRLAQAKALVEAAREWNPKRERWQELRQRAASIEKALKV